MKLKFIAAICVLLAIPALARAQQGAPTKADVQEVAQIISNDKAKTQAYCALTKAYSQLNEAEQKNDSATVKTLNEQIEPLVDKLGPEYAKVNDGWNQIDLNSDEGKEILSIFSDLDKLCAG